MYLIIHYICHEETKNILLRCKYLISIIISGIRIKKYLLLNLIFYQYFNGFQMSTENKFFLHVN
jgi:hypothetical protein